MLEGVRVGPPLEEGVFMGPLVSQKAYEKVLSFRTAEAPMPEICAAF